MDFISKVTAVNAESGEEIYGSLKWIKEHYKIVKKEINYTPDPRNLFRAYKNIHWLCVPKSNQLRLL